MASSGFVASLQRILSTWALNFINLLVYVLTYGYLTFSEGRYYAFTNKWANWNLYFKCEPKIFLRATEEREICDFVKRATKVRVVAGGHSFNPSPLSNDLLISLDQYNRVVKFDKDLGLITVQAGMRLRELIKVSEKAGWALPVMGTANIQSIGGLIASDLHASGRESGYLSQQIEAIRIVNSKGVAETFTKNTEEFKSAIGGIGALGVVVEVTLQLVPKFLVRRVTTYVDREEAEDALEMFLEKHDHVGFFYIGGLNAKRIRLTTYDRAQPHERITFLVYFKNFIAQIFDLLNGGFILDFARYFPSLLNTGYFIWNSTFLGQPFVNNPGASFTTNLFFQHDEMEYGLPRENFRRCISSLMDYLDRTGTVALMEVRFTVHHATTRSLLGPGADRETCWIEILPTLSHDTRKIFAATEHIFEENGGRPHLGKYTTYQKPDMEKHHGEENIQRWLIAREKQDPEGKFVNNFVHQVFMDERPSNPSHPHF